MTLGIRLNNPGDIRHGEHWAGLSAFQSDRDFCQFVSPEYGIRAMVKILATYKSRGVDTIQKGISSWAPPSENDTDAYINAVCLDCDVKPTEIIDLTGSLLPTLLKAIIRHEQGVQPYSDAQIQAGITLAGVVWNPPKAGPQQVLSLAAPSSVVQSPNALSGAWSRLAALRFPKTTVTQSPLSVSSSSAGSSLKTEGNSMSTPVVAAAVPSLVASLQALQAFITNLGTDPTKVALTFPGAAAVLLGELQLQVPVLVATEFGAAQAEVNAKIASWITALQAKAA